MAQRYAYGDSKVYGKPCVAKANDGNLAGELLTVAEQYDEIARERFDADKGTVTESTAEELWNEAIDKVRSRLNVERDNNHADYLKRAINQAERVEKKAF